MLVQAFFAFGLLIALTIFRCKMADAQPATNEKKPDLKQE